MSRDTPSLDTVTVDVHDVKCTWRRGEDCREEDTKIVSYRSVMHDSKGRRDSRTSFPDVSTVVYRFAPSMAKIEIHPNDRRVRNPPWKSSRAA